MQPNTVSRYLLHLQVFVIKVSDTSHRIGLAIKLVARATVVPLKKADGLTEIIIGYIHEHFWVAFCKATRPVLHHLATRVSVQG